LQMKLALLLLLTLSSTSLQDVVKDSQHRNEDRGPEITANTSSLKHQHLLSPHKIRQKRHPLPDPSTFNTNGQLKWQRWDGSLSNEAVSIDNTYVGRKDYVCKYQCHAGFYNPNSGSYCHYTNGGEVHKDPSFEILVNENNFEILEWKKGSANSAVQHSVRTCSSDEIYVGRNEYGLGKVHQIKKTFFLPWKTKVYTYGDNYEVLTVSKDVKSEHISKVEYNNNEAKITQYPSATMHVSTIVNNECSSTLKTFNFSKTYQMKRRWDIHSSVMLGEKRTISAAIPNISMEISPELSPEYSGALTDTQDFTHSTSLELNIPPNHYCRAYIAEYHFKVNIPFSARLDRTYGNGKSTGRSVTGTYENIWNGEVQAVVDRCEPVANASPCPENPDPNSHVP
uniref:Natterin-4-like n=1 Tax=Seriola dumerili TaxID=41447 RepID=A0A3B4UJA7_SERDU